MRIVVMLSVVGLLVSSAVGVNAAKTDAAKQACTEAIAKQAGVEVAAISGIEVVPKDGQWMQINATPAGSETAWTCKADAKGTVKDGSVENLGS